MWAVGHRVSLTGVVVFALALAACSEPSYGSERDAATPTGDASPSEMGKITRDASEAFDARGVDEPEAAVSQTEDAQAMDAEPPTDDAATMPSSPPAWALPLFGQYGLRARFFTRDSLGTPGKTEWVMLGTYGYDAAKQRVTLTTTLCEAIGTATFLGGITTDSGPVYPQTFPQRVYTVQNDASGWSTDNAPWSVGFAATPLVDCPTPGARVPAHFTQIWNTDGMCSCPLDASVLPDHSSDCRVNDVDNDGQPAATVAFTGAVKTRFHVRMFDTSRIVHGVIDPVSRHHDAQHATATDMMQLTCGASPCAKTALKLCGSEDNPVLVRPLGDGGAFTCADVLSRKAELFGTDPITFPNSGC